MLRCFYFILCLLPLTLSAETITDERAENVRLQIFLDANHFGPGAIDGKMGTYTKMAVEAYNKRHGLPQGDWEAVKKLAKQDTPDIYAVAIVPEIASKMVDTSFPNNKNRSSQSRRNDMPYRSIGEFMAERYHTTVDFLKLLNGEDKVNKATKRTPLIVPNIEPFQIELVAHGRTHKKDPVLSQRWAVIDTTKQQLRIYEPLNDVPRPPESSEQEGEDIAALPEDLPAAAEADTTTLPLRTEVNTEAMENGAPPKALIIQEDTPAPALTPWDEHRALIVAAFPITIGQPQFIRRGQWKMMNAIEFPTWRYDSSLLKTGQRSNNSLTIPAGPNNPVGVIWMGLSRRGIGMHGTDSPETIGRAKSAGCVRLTNWDAIEMPNYIRPGATIFIK